MKMKIFIFMTLCLTNITRQQGSCKVHLLQSFGLRSLVEPSSENTLCPGITQNCCTKTDQLKIHKIWNKHAKKEIEANYSKLADLIMEINEATNELKGKLVCKEILEEYKK